MTDWLSGCWGCGRSDVKKRPRAAKLYYPHRCPHGSACRAGDNLAGRAGNNWPLCRDCHAAKRRYYLTGGEPA